MCVFFPRDFPGFSQVFGKFSQFFCCWDMLSSFFEVPLEALAVHFFKEKLLVFCSRLATPSRCDLPMVFVKVLMFRMCFFRD